MQSSLLSLACAIFVRTSALHARSEPHPLVDWYADRINGTQHDLSPAEVEWAIKRLRERPGEIVAAMSCDGPDGLKGDVACSPDYVRMYDVVRKTSSNPCFASIKHGFLCEGPKYDQWQQENAEHIQSWANTILSAKLTPGGGILFLGNSYIGSLYQDFVCQMRHRLRKWEVTLMKEIYRNRTVSGYVHPSEDSFDHYPLVERYYGVDPSDGFMRDGLTYTPEISVATLDNGARIFSAYNAHHLFGGEAALQTLMDHLGVDLSRLDAIILGDINPLDWARLYLFPKGYTGEMWVWNKHRFFDYFQKQRFRGQLLLWTSFMEFASTQELRNTSVYDYGIDILRDPAFGENSPVPCSVFECDQSREQHQCIPGMAASVGAAIAQKLGGMPGAARSVIAVPSDDTLRSGAAPSWRAAHWPHAGAALMLLWASSRR